jgi:hypothetical protein
MSKIDKNVSIKTRVNLSNYCNQGEAMRKLEFEMKLHIQSFVKSIGNRKKKPIF